MEKNSHCEFCGKTKEKVASTTQGMFCAECLDGLIFEFEKALDELEED